MCPPLSFVSRDSTKVSGAVLAAGVGSAGTALAASAPDARRRMEATRQLGPRDALRPHTLAKVIGLFASWPAGQRSDPPEGRSRRRLLGLRAATTAPYARTTAITDDVVGLHRRNVRRGGMRNDLGRSGKTCLGFEPRRFQRKTLRVWTLAERLTRPVPASRNGRPEIEPGNSL